MDSTNRVLIVSDGVADEQPLIDAAVALGTPASVGGTLLRIAPPAWSPLAPLPRPLPRFPTGGDWQVLADASLAELDIQRQRHPLTLAAHQPAPWPREGLTALTRQLLTPPHGTLLIVRRPGAAPYRRVLVAIELSADRAADCLQLARRFAPAAELTVLHALPRQPDAADQACPPDQREAALDRLDALLDQAGLSPRQAFKIAECAHAPELILDKERELLADLLVIGGRTPSALRRLFYRGVMPQVLAQAGCDVLIAPAQPR